MMVMREEKITQQHYASAPIHWRIDVRSLGSQIIISYSLGNSAFALHILPFYLSACDYDIGGIVGKSSQS